MERVLDRHRISIEHRDRGDFSDYSRVCLGIHPHGIHKCVYGFDGWHASPDRNRREYVSFYRIGDAVASSRPHIVEFRPYPIGFCRHVRYGDKVLYSIHKVE